MSEQIASALRSGDSDSALSLAQALVASAPEQADSHYWLAMALQAKRENAAAIAAIDEAIRLAPNRDEFGLLRSMLQLGQANLGEVQASLMDALALNPNQLEAYVGLIHIAVGQNNLPEAERLLRLAERVDADDGDVALAKGVLLQAQGNHDAALAVFTRISELQPNNVLALSSLGSAYLQKNMPAFAVQALSRACTLSPEQPALLRTLIQCQLANQDYAAVAESLDRLLAMVGSDRSALQMRLQWRQHNGDLAGALQDAHALHAAMPSDVTAIASVCQLHMQLGDSETARTLVADALASNMDSDPLWQLCCTVEAAITGDSKVLIERWLLARPQSGPAHEALAVYCEARGDLVAAAEAAHTALALSEALPLAQFVKLRQEVRENPSAALDRLVELSQRARSPDAQRMVLAWIGLASDRLGKYADAADAFTRMLKIVLPQKTLPSPYPAHHLPEASVEGRLLWAPTGARIEPVFTALSPLLGTRLLADRNQASAARDDGFGAFRAEPGSENAGSAFSWRTGVQAMGLEPAEAVDWLPHWDAYTAAALAGAELTVLMIDPRDALLNWMVFGSAQSYVFHPKIVQSARWLAAAFMAVADTAQASPQKVHLIRIDSPENDAQMIAEQLQSALALEGLPDAEVLAKPVLALGGMPNQFPAGHWRNYQDSFSEAFAVLTPAAVRLGYSAD